MKKIILLFLLFTFKVKAINFYTDYSEYSNYSEEIIMDTDLIKVDIKEEKKYFELNKIICDYNQICPYINYDNYEQIESDYQNEKPEEKENREIIVDDNSYYANVLPIRYIKIDNTNNVKFKEIAIAIDGEYIRYGYEYKNCKYDFYNNSIEIWENGYYIIDLKDYYELDRIIINFLFDNYEGIYKYQISMNREKDANTFLSNNIDMQIIKGDVSFVINYQGLNFINPDYEKSVFDQQKYDANLQHYIEDIKYKYIDKIYEKYDVIKNYTSYETDNYDQLKLYRYKKRDKIEVQDEIIINNYAYDLDDYIKATKEYKVDDNIQINKNGIYEMIILFDNLEIKREVKVDILENKIKEDEYHQLVNEIEEQNNSIFDLRNKINEKDYYIKTILEEKDKIGNQINSLNHLIEDKEQSGFIDTENSKYNSKRIVIILSSIIFLLIIQKRIRKNNN